MKEELSLEEFCGIIFESFEKLYKAAVTNDQNLFLLSYMVYSGLGNLGEIDVTKIDREDVLETYKTLSVLKKYLNHKSTDQYFKISIEDQTISEIDHI